MPVGDHILTAKGYQYLTHLTQLHIHVYKCYMDASILVIYDENI